MTGDILHSTQYYIKYINRAILANLQHRPLKLGQLIVLLYMKQTYGYKKNSVPILMAIHCFPVPTCLILKCYQFSTKKTLNKATNSS